MAIEQLINEIESMKNIAKKDFLAKIKNPNNWEMDLVWSGDSMSILHEKGGERGKAFCIDVYSTSLTVTLGTEIILDDDLIYPTFFQKLCGHKPKKSELRKLIDGMVEDFKVKEQIKKLQNKRDALKSIIKK